MSGVEGVELGANHAEWSERIALFGQDVSQTLHVAAAEYLR